MLQAENEVAMGKAVCAEKVVSRSSEELQKRQDEELEPGL